jgi:hypothetical protein
MKNKVKNKTIGDKVYNWVTIEENNALMWRVWRWAVAFFLMSNLFRLLVA